LVEAEKEKRYRLLNSAVFKTPHIDMGGPRLILVVETSEGPTAFYKSTGTGTGEESEGMWLPVGGLASRSNGDQWFAKLPSSHSQAGERSKFPREGTEFYDIGSRLAEKFGQKNPPIINWSDWIQTKSGMPSWQQLEKIPHNQLPYRSPYTGKMLSKYKIGRADYGMMVVNAFLNSHGALKREWGEGRKFYGSPLDPPKNKYSIRDVKRLVRGERLPGPPAQ